MERVGVPSTIDIKIDKAIKLLDENVTAVSNLLPPGFSGRFSPRTVEMISKEDLELNSDKRLKLINRETLDFLSVKTKKV